LATLIQRSFAGGEITPALYARVDQTKYAYGLRTLRNFFVMRHGGAANRPGTKFVREVKDSSKKSVLKPFIFNEDNTYVIEFSDGCVRFTRNGRTLTRDSDDITGLTNTTPAVLTLGDPGVTANSQFFIYDATSVTPTSSGLIFLIEDLSSFAGNPNLQDVGDQPNRVQTFETQSEDVVLKTIQIYLGLTNSNFSVDPNATLDLEVYEDDGNGQPDFTSLVATTSVAFPQGVGPTLVNANFNNEVLLANTTYWFTVKPKAVAFDSNTNRLSYYRMRSTTPGYNPDPTVINVGEFIFENNPVFTNTFKTYQPLGFSSDIAMRIIVEGDPTPVLSTGDGDEITLSGLSELPNINGRTFKLVDIGNNQFELYNLDGSPFDGSGVNYVSGGVVNSVLELKSPYSESELCDLHINQSADIVTITHPNHPPQELTRVGESDFMLSDILLEPRVLAPQNVTAGNGAQGTITHKYVVTAIDGTTFEESVASEEVSIVRDTASISDPIAILWDLVSGATEYNIYKEENGVFGLIGISAGSRYDDINVAPDTTQTPPIANNPFDDFAVNITAITQSSPVIITYTGETELDLGDSVSFRNILGMTELNGNTYKILTIDAATKQITLDGVDSTSFNAYVSGGTVFKPGVYPSTSTYYQQRLLFANTDEKVETVWASRSAQFKNFSTSGNLQDDDSLSFTMAGRQVNEIRHLVDLGKLIALTSTGEWTIEGDGSGILTPTAINPRKHSYNGSNNMQPIVINGSAIYVQARGSIVRDLGFDFQIDGYRGNDLTLFSAHLFDDYTLTDWSYQQVPHSVLWVVRDDGVLLSLTYIREQQMTAWARHDFDGGFVESVTVVPEGNEDILYVIVRREINGRTTRYIERMNSRNIIDLTDNIFMDSTLSFDGRNKGDTTVTISGGTTWEYTEKIDMTSTDDLFSSTDIGNQIHVRYSVKQGEYSFDYQGDKVIRFEITDYVSATEVKVKPHRTVDLELRNVAISSFGKAVDKIAGLWHLEGKELSIFADKFAVASPYNKSFQKYKVVNGQVELDRAYVVIHAGLPYLSDMETLDMDSAQTESMIDKVKNPTHIAMYIEESRGIFAGYKPPEDDCVDALESLQEFTVRENEHYDDPVDSVTGIVEANIQSEYNKHGRVFIRQVDPVPLSILAVAPAGYYVVR